MAMNTNFADWYRAASVTPPAELIEKRWAGVEAATAALTEQVALELLNLFLFSPAQDYEFPEALDALFRKADPTFPKSGNLQELRVVAGAILRNALEANHALSNLIALGLTCGCFGSRRASVATQDHLLAAERKLALRSRALRNPAFPPSYTTPAGLTKAKLVEQLPADHFQPNATPNLREPLAALLADQSAKIGAGINAAIIGLWRTVQAQGEELNLLWWLQNAHSKELNAPFEKLQTAQAVLTFAVELDALTVFVPGSVSIRALIVRALAETSANGKKLSIAEVVNATAADWRAKVSKRSPSPAAILLCPMLLAVCKSLETDGPKDWLPVYRKSSGMTADYKGEASELSYQFYLELQFVRSISGTGK